MTDATRPLSDLDTTLTPATEGAFGSVNDGLQPDPAAPPLPSLRQAVREDLSHARELARGRAVAARQAVVEEPVRAAVTALGIGVIIGLLLRR